MECDQKDKTRFTNWLRTLGFPETESLDSDTFYKSLNNGILLLKVIDVTRPGSVDWSKVNWNSQNTFKLLANCNLAVSVLQQTADVEGLVRGKDIVEENPKAVLSLLWVLMREYFARNHGVKSEEQFKEIANQYLPQGENGFIAAVDHAELDSELLMIVLYYGEEGEIFMTFHDESKLDCSLLPTNFGELECRPQTSDKPVQFTMKKGTIAKSKRIEKRDEVSDEPSETMKPIQPAIFIAEKVKEITEKAKEKSIKIESQIADDRKVIIKEEKVNLVTLTSNGEEVPILFKEQKLKFKKSRNVGSKKDQQQDIPTPNIISSFILPTITVTRPTDMPAEHDLPHEYQSTMSSRMYSHRKRVMNVLGPVDTNKAKSCNKPPAKPSRSRSPMVAKIEACYASVGGVPANPKFEDYKDCENMHSPASTDYYLSCNPKNNLNSISKFDKATRESVLKNKSPKKGIQARILMEEKQTYGVKRLEEMKILSDRMTTFLFILSSSKLQKHFEKPLEEYTKTKHFTNFRVGETRHTTPAILKFGKALSHESQLRLNKINIFFEAEVTLPEVFQGESSWDTKSEFSEAQAKVAAELELQQVSLTVGTLLADFRDSPAKKALQCVAEKIEEIVSMPFSVTASLFDKVLKSKLNIKEKIVVKRIEGLLKSVQKSGQDSKPKITLIKPEIKTMDYLQKDKLNSMILDGLKNSYKSILKQKVLNSSVTCN